MSGDLDARARRQDREERVQWEEERAKMKKENKTLRDELKRMAKKLKLMETTLVQQQHVLDRYQQELVAYGKQNIENNVPDNKRATDHNDTDNLDKRVIKRVKSDGTKLRHSLPLADRHATDENQAHSSPSRRRSLPERDRSSSDQGPVATTSASWMNRKPTDRQQPALINATELLRSRPSVHIPSLQRNDLSNKHNYHATANSDDAFLNDRRADTVKTESKCEPPTGARHASSNARCRPYQSPFTRFSSVPKPESRPIQRPEPKKSPFAYIEVVRNRDERAAMPAHDCIECRKYYDALDGIVPEHEMKDMCSRHRARSEPYQTPDDFWRLSFPDSHAKDSLSP